VFGPAVPVSRSKRLRHTLVANIIFSAACQDCIRANGGRSTIEEAEDGNIYINLMAKYPPTAEIEQTI